MKKEVFTVGVEVFIPPDFFERPHGCLGSRNSRRDIVIISKVVCKMIESIDICYCH
jgi:hypothetical protein